MNLKVMVVDDSATMRKVIISALIDLGITRENIGDSHNGIDALGKLKHTKYDLILTDWNMPKMDGLTLVKHIRHIHLYDDTQIIMITTEGSRPEVLKALKSGINNYIVKPFTPDTLKTKLIPCLKKFS